MEELKNINKKSKSFKRYSEEFKMAALRLYYIHKMKIAKICEIMNICEKTLYNWRIKYVCDPINKYNFDSNLLYKSMIPKERLNYKLNFVKKYLESQVINNPSFSYKKTLEFIKKQFNISLSKSTLYNYINKIGITRKKAKIRVIVLNKDKYKNDLIKYNNKLSECKNNKKQIISIDEFSIRTELTPSYGYNYKGKPVEFKVKKKINVSYSILLAINKHKIVDYFATIGSIDSNCYNKFIKKIIKGKRNICLLMDNARIHKSKICQKTYNDNKIDIFYNIPYTPELNPIEYANNKIKNYIKRNLNSTVTTLLKTLKHALIKITRKDLLHFYKKSFEDNLTKLNKEFLIDCSVNNT